MRWFFTGWKDNEVSIKNETPFQKKLSCLQRTGIRELYEFKNWSKTMFPGKAIII